MFYPSQLLVCFHPLALLKCPYTLTFILFLFSSHFFCSFHFFFNYFRVLPYIPACLLSFPFPFIIPPHLYLSSEFLSNTPFCTNYLTLRLPFLYIPSPFSLLHLPPHSTSFNPPPSTPLPFYSSPSPLSNPSPSFIYFTRVSILS